MRPLRVVDGVVVSPSTPPPTNGSQVSSHWLPTTKNETQPLSDMGAITAGPKLHVAIIMDGNARWARARGLTRIQGHTQGAIRVKEVVGAAAQCDIEVLTLYAFASGNWKRPAAQVTDLMRLMTRAIKEEGRRSVAQGVRIRVIGRRDRLPKNLLKAIEDAEEESKGCTRLEFRIALDYSSREAMVRASNLLAAPSDLRSSSERQDANHESFERAIHAATGAGIPRDVDLLIRTGGEHRLSDFLLWECANAEICFLDFGWPDFTATNLAEAVSDYKKRRQR